jgi:glycyl-tRNA synthetase beta subunit
MALYKALQKTGRSKRAPGSVDDFLNAFLPLIPLVNSFFDKVLVIARQKPLRENRLGLLQQLVALTHGVADFSRLEGF